MISGVLGRVTVIVTQNRGRITPLITTPEPPSKIQGFGRRVRGFGLRASGSRFRA